MDGADRREAILQAAIPLFAKHGFHAVKTREIAKAASVSEALVFRHFPSKEALYREIQREAHRADEESEALGRYLSLPPSTDKLMLGLHLLLSHLAARPPPGKDAMPRLVMQSLLEDGELARVHFERFQRDLWPSFAESLHAAREARETEDVGTPQQLLMWFSHHLGFATRVLQLPGTSVDYGLPAAELAEHQTRFVLRGLGIKPDVIRQNYQPQRLLKLLA